MTEKERFDLAVRQAKEGWGDGPLLMVQVDGKWGAAPLGSGRDIDGQTGSNDK